MVQGWTLRWLLNILAIIITAAIIPAFNLTIWAAVVGSVFLGVINAIIRPLLILLTLPLNLLTLGLFTLVINGFMLWVTSLTIQGFDIDSFGWAMVCSIVISMVSFIISLFVDDKEFKFK
jgi:putative membrane protein